MIPPWPLFADEVAPPKMKGESIVSVFKTALERQGVQLTEDQVSDVLAEVMERGVNMNARHGFQPPRP